MTDKAPDPTVLVVDDDEDLLQLVEMRLAAAGHLVATATSAEAALIFLRDRRPRLVITDLRMAEMGGLALFEQIRTNFPALPVIILTAHGSIPEAVEATRRGVFSFLTKPFDGKELLAEANRALRLTGDGFAATGTGGSAAWRRRIITQSSKMQQLLAKLELVAQTRSSVLLLGESGSGKEVLARAIHEASDRATGPFVAFNCAAVPETLLASELFGHERGAFTGAVKNHVGLFRATDGGTLFLDEIGDMPLEVQARLLRALEERTVTPVGSTEVIAVDLRLISATHKDLSRLVRDGAFREDLLYRINVVVLEIPPLRERPEDIPLLARHFLDRIAAEIGREVHSFAPDALELLIASAWPGNVRQLLNVVEQSVALSTSPVVPADRVAEALRENVLAMPPLVDARRQFERDYLVRVLKIADGNVAQAAQLAKRNRTEFYRLLRRHDLDPGSFQVKDD